MHTILKWSVPNFRAGMNEPPIKLATAVSSNSTNYNREIDAILLVLKHILSAQPEISANTIYMFRDSIVAINATSLSPQEIHQIKIEEIISISNSLKCFSFNVTHSPAHCSIPRKEEAGRLAKVGMWAAQKMIREQKISLATAKT